MSPYDPVRVREVGNKPVSFWIGHPTALRIFMGSCIFPMIMRVNGRICFVQILQKPEFLWLEKSPGGKSIKRDMDDTRKDTYLRRDEPIFMAPSTLIHLIARSSEIDHIFDHAMTVEWWNTGVSSFISGSGFIVRSSLPDCPSPIIECSLSC